MKNLKHYLAFLILVGSTSLSKSQTISFVDTSGNHTANSLTSNSSIKFAYAKLLYEGPSSVSHKTRSLKNFHFKSIVTSTQNPITNISIFPNPCSESLWITGLAQNSIVTFYDLAGKSLYRNQNYNGGTIDLSYYPKGVIIVSILTNKSEVIKKIVKN